MAILYYSLNANFESCTSIQAKIAKLDVLIDTLFTTATKATSTGNIASYKIDDGQSIQEVYYRDMEQVMKALKAYEQQRQFYVNKLLGNEYRQVSGKNLNRWGY
jgi:sulfur relay (sulfurtransferase) DsrF/TusC family protein